MPITDVRTQTLSVPPAGVHAAATLEELVGRISAAGAESRKALRASLISALMGLDAPETPARLPSAIDTPSDSATRPLPKWRLRRVMDHVQSHLSERITLGDLAASAGLSRMYFAAQFRAATGLRPHEYVLRRRIERAQALLVESGDSLVEIALAVGFQTQAHFTTVFKRFTGETPRQWRVMYGQFA